LLLLTQLSHLLSRRFTASRSLSREISHLAFASLVGRDVGLRGGLLCRWISLI
jgi:hypothetical protein